MICLIHSHQFFNLINNFIVFTSMSCTRKLINTGSEYGQNQNTGGKFICTYLCETTKVTVENNNNEIE